MILDCRLLKTCDLGSLIWLIQEVPTNSLVLWSRGWNTGVTARGKELKLEIIRKCEVKILVDDWLVTLYGLLVYSWHDSGFPRVQLTSGCFVARRVM